MKKLLVCLVFVLGCESPVDAGFIPGIIGPAYAPMVVTFSGNLNVPEMYAACDEWNEAEADVFRCAWDMNAPPLAHEGEPGYVSVEIIQINAEGVLAGTSITDLNWISQVDSARIRISPNWPLATEVIVHELGHSVGLEHDDELPDSCMHNPVPMPCEITSHDRNLLAEGLDEG